MKILRPRATTSTSAYLDLFEQTLEGNTQEANWRLAGLATYL